MVWILGLMAVLVVLGIAAATQVSSTRLTLERAFARRVAEQAALSAIEEACARLEESLPRIAPAAAGERRDLGAALCWPDGRRLTASTVVEPEVTRSAMDPGQIEVGAVEAVSSPWQIVCDELADGSTAITEAGVLQLTAKIVVKAAPGPVRRKVTVRRYIRAAPESPGSDLTIRILAHDVATVVEEP
ncbi:MAG: hypothetical protein HY815_18100 [Candidatus Riflebacteria bacterium]|nr:hypothetical protein [Candidatus Riflebacteria bacterium]